MSDATPARGDATKPPSSEPEADPILENPVDETPVEATATGEVAPAAPPAEAAASPMAGAQVVYVTAPVPPKRRSNRVVGVLLALLGAMLFALIYLGVVALMLSVFIAPDSVAEEIANFVSDASFWVPILFFALGFVLIVLMLNRAAWWLHVLGSILVALIVYFGSIGMLLLINNVVVLSPAKASSAFSSLAVNPIIIAAALVAREVSIWVGFLIAVRGRRVTSRNAEERAAFDREQAEKKAELEGKAAQG